MSGGRLGQRQIDCDRRAAACLGRGHPATRIAHRFRGDRQAMPAARVTNFDAHAAGRTAADHPDMAATVLNSVRQKIPERLRQPSAVGVNGHRAGRPVQVDSTADAARREV
jgi:hypothetical protein